MKNLIRIVCVAFVLAFGQAYAEEKPDPTQCPGIIAASARIQAAETPEAAVEAFQAFAKAHEQSLVMDDEAVKEAIADIKAGSLQQWRDSIWDDITDEMTFHGCSVSPKRS